MIPNEVLKFISRINIGVGPAFVKILQDINGEAVLRTFAYRNTKKYGIECKEVVKEYLDRVLVSGSLYFTQMAGYKVIFRDDQKTRYNAYSPSMDDTFYETNNMWRPNMSANFLDKAKDVEKILKIYIPHFIFNYGTDDIMEYARRYKQFSEIELLAKNGFGYLYKDRRIFKLKPEKKKKLISWLVKNKQYVSNHLPNYQYISESIRKGLNGDELDMERCIDEYQKQFKENGFNYSRNECQEVYKYLNHPKVVQLLGLHSYIDYLKMSKKVNRNIDDRGVRFPRDLRKQHDDLVKLINVEKNRITDQALAEIKKALIKYELSYKGLQIIIPESQEDLIRLGNELKNCVGTCGYGEKMANGNCIILEIRKEGEPIECCELKVNEEKTKLTINQLRGKHNQPSKEHEQAEKLIDQFIQIYRKNAVSMLAQ